MSGTATFDRWIGEILAALASAQPKRLHLLPASFGLPAVQEDFETMKLWDDWSNTVQWLEREGYIRYERYSSGTENEPVFYDTELTQLGRNRMFETFPQSEIDIVAPDGTLRSRTKAILDSKQATIPDAMVQIHAGDEIRRKIPNGTEEAFEVIDPVYHGNFHGIPEHFQVKIRRKGTFPAGSGGHYSFHVSGPNARVNFHSVDNSTNRVGSDTVFKDLRGAYERAALEQEDEARIMALIDEMESAKDGGNFKDAYVKFMQQAAEHMTVAAPFIPALIEYLKS